MLKEIARVLQTPNYSILSCAVRCSLVAGLVAGFASMGLTVGSQPQAPLNDLQSNTVNPFNPLGSGKILDVPYVNQGATNWCFHASLSMVMQYYGKEVQPADIARAYRQSPEESMNIFDIMLGGIDSYISNWRDLSVEHGVGTWGFDDYKLRIDNSSPVIAANFGFPGHTVVGYSLENGQRKLYIHDPSGRLTWLVWKAGNIAYAPVNWERFAELSWNQITIRSRVTARIATLRLKT